MRTRMKASMIWLVTAGLASTGCAEPPTCHELRNCPIESKTDSGSALDGRSSDEIHSDSTNPIDGSADATEGADAEANDAGPRCGDGTIDTPSLDFHGGEFS